jgi:tetratricopeptide (TPR) repeat protein
MINLIKCKNFFAGFSILLPLFLFPGILSAQKAKVDSLKKLLAVEKTDTGKVKLMWQIASAANFYNPDTALLIAQQALFKAKNTSYLEGESNSLKILANTFMYMGNYPTSLDLNLQRLKLEEKRNKPRYLAGTLMNIGIVYVYEDEYRKALEYYRKSDSVIKKNNLDDVIKNQMLLNIGDVFFRMQVYDSAYLYLSESLALAKKNEDGFMMGATMGTLAHNYRSKKEFPEALMNYRGAINFLKDGVDNDNYCETTLGLAKLFRLLNKADSAVHYAKISMMIARNDGRLSRELEATRFLTEYYSEAKKIDSAFAYVSYVQQLNDSVNSKSKIREMLSISSSEQFRQRDLEQQKKEEKKKRFKQLQFLLIGIFIPGFFFLTFLLNRVKIHMKLVRLLGVLSLLFLFEYLTLLLHPAIANFTNHIPIYEILIFVVIAAILIPLHHKVEHWLIHRLTHHRLHIIKKEEKNTTAKPEETKNPVP